MLLKIELENFFSIKNRICLDFVAAKSNTKQARELSDNVIDWNGTKILKTIGLFGPDASGKSNILKAINFCCRMILESHKRSPEVSFDLDVEESNGTRKLFQILLRLLDVVRNGKSLTMDEFDMGLHTRLADFILDLIHASESSQLLFTSHNTNLIDMRRLRKDQVVSVNKLEETYGGLIMAKQRTPSPSRTMKRVFLVFCKSETDYPFQPRYGKLQL